MWIAIAVVSLVLTVLGMVYLVRRFRRFSIVKRLSGGRRWLEVLLGFFPILLCILFGIFDFINTIVVVLHFVVFWLIGDGIAALLSLFFRKKPIEEPTSEQPKNPPVYWTGLMVILVCTVYLSIGYYLAYHVDKTVYTLTTEKPLPNGNLRIAHIADCHIGTTFDGEEFGTYLAEIQEQNPDLLVITGDFVDDSTSREDMLTACKALGKIQTTYGVFFAYGNHDKGYYNRDAYTPQELEASLEANGVTVLEDETVLIANTFYLVGRMDRSEGNRISFAEGQPGAPDTAPTVTYSSGRMSIDTLTAELDRDKYTIVLNHQPNDYAAEAAAEVDLVLSGHTHGGQLIPLGPIGILMGANDRIYGKEVRDNTTFIVTSGISNWEFHFKTGTKSEFVVIDISAS